MSAAPFDVVPDREVGDVVVERVGGEVAPPHVLVDGAVDVVAQDAARSIEGALRSNPRCRPRRCRVHAAAPAGSAASTSVSSSSSGASPSSGSASGTGSSPCEGALAARKVATSMVSRPKNTCARRKRRPTRRQLRNSRAPPRAAHRWRRRSPSARCPSSRSRTQPPTRKALKPASRRRYSTRSALGEMWERETVCSDRGMIRGCAAGVAVDASGEFNAFGFLA